MNEPPLDFHPEECENFAAAYIQAATADHQETVALCQAITAKRQAITARKRAAAAWQKFIAVDKHADKMRSDKYTKYSARADQFTAAIRLSVIAERQCIAAFNQAATLRMFSDAADRKAAKARKHLLEARRHAAQLANHVALSFNTIFSGKKARLL